MRGSRSRSICPTSLEADVSALGRSVYVIDELVDGGTDRLYASTDGLHFSARPVPCNNRRSIGLIQAVPTSANDVAMLCDDPIGFARRQEGLPVERYRPDLPFRRRHGHGRYPGAAWASPLRQPGRRDVLLRFVHLRQRQGAGPGRCRSASATAGQAETTSPIRRTRPPGSCTPQQVSSTVLVSSMSRATPA